MSNCNDPNEFMICDICTQPYDDDLRQAKFLACHHTFCSLCLTKLLRNQGNRAAIPCPTCRNPTKLPSTGVAGLQRNFYIESLRCVSKKNEQHTKNICHEHGCPLSFFCETCKTAICAECVLRYHDKIDGHVITDVAEARQTLLDQMDIRKISLEQIQGNMTKLELEMSQLAAAKETTKRRIKEFMQLAHKKLEERQEMLIQCNEDAVDAMQNTLLSIKQTLQEAIDNLSKNLKQAEQLAKTGTMMEIIAINQNLMDTPEAMRSYFADLNLGKNFTSFDSNKGWEALRNSLHNLGGINIQSFLPAKVKIKTDKKVSPGKKYQIKLEVFSHNGEIVPVTTSHFTVEITDPTDEKMQCTLNTTNNEFTVTFTPEISGAHGVSVFFLGQRLTNE